MSEEIERLLVRIEANTTQFETTIKKMNRSLHGAQAETRRSMAEIQKSVDSAAIGIRRSALMATSAMTALGVSFGAAQLVKDFREGEEAAKRLEAVLKTTGHAAGLSYGQIASWARELEEETGRSATEIQNAAAQLATFTSIGRREFTEAIEVATDMAAVFGGDLKSNLDAVARALDDPIEGFANLRKRGFALTDAELKRAEAHMKAGRFAEAQQVVLKNLSSQVDGAAKAVNTGLTKALNDLQRQAGDTFKQLADERGTAAAIAALELATKSVVFLGDNMDVLLDSAQALAVFAGTQYVASWLLAEKGMVRASIAAVAAKGHIGALNAALAANPAGLAALAIAALAASITYLVKRTSEGEVMARRLAEQSKRNAAAFDEYEKAARKAADATGEAKKQADALVATKRELYFIEIRNAQALAETTLQMATQRAEMAKLAAQEALSGKPKSEGEAIGQFAYAGGSEREAHRAQQQADQANDDLVKQLSDYAELQERIRNGFKDNPTPLEYTPKVDKGAAKAAERRKRLLEDLKAQTALEVAQLDEQVAKVRELERQAEITARIRQLEDAGFKAAQAKAISSEVQTKLDEARARAMEREEGLLKRGWDLDIARLDENWKTVRAIEEEVEKRELVAALAKVTADETSAIAKAESMLAAIQSARVDAAKRGLDLAREEHRLAVAQLSGNRQLTKQLQDQAAIRERTKAYQAEGYGLNPAEAERRATDEVTRERTAATYGEHRELFASAFSDGIRAAMAGDLQGFLSNEFGNFADTMMQKAGEQIFDSLFGGVDAVAEGASQGAAMAATVTPAITGAGSIVATEWASAITTAGAMAGASIASAIAGANITKFAMLPGFSEGGWTGPGGVNQPKGIVHGDEVVWSQRDVARAGGVAVVEAMRKGVPGYAKGGVVGRSVIPGVNAAMNRMNGASHAQQQPVIVKLAVEEGALFHPTIEAVSGRVSVQTTAMGVATVQDQQRTNAMRRRQSLVG